MSNIRKFDTKVQYLKYKVLREVAREALIKCNRSRISDWNTCKNLVKTNVSKYIYEKTNRSPMILPILMEV